MYIALFCRNTEVNRLFHLGDQFDTKLLHRPENEGITFPLVYPFIKHWPGWDQFTNGLTRGNVMLPFFGGWSNFVSSWSPRWKPRLTSVFLQNKDICMYFGRINRGLVLKFQKIFFLWRPFFRNAFHWRSKRPAWSTWINNFIKGSRGWSFLTQ